MATTIETPQTGPTPRITTGKVRAHQTQNEGLVFEKSSPGKRAYKLPPLDVPEVDVSALLGETQRTQSAELPELSEIEIIRHFTRLSTWNYAIDLGMYPLGSCTMKYNPRVNELVARIEGLAEAHPLQPEALSHMIPPPRIHVLDKQPANTRRFFLAASVLQPEERGIRVTVDHFVSFGFNQLTRLAHDFMTAHGDRRGKARVEEAASGGTQHAVKRVHDDLQRLRQRLVVLALGFLATFPDLIDDGRQTMTRA